MKNIRSGDSAATGATVDIRSMIHVIRGQQVLLDRDLAAIYHVMTGRLNEAVKRNRERFPEEFMFQLSDLEMKELIANCDRFSTMKHSPSRMYAFTEQGVAMLSAVLKSEIAVRESVRIIKTFVAMRRTLASMTPMLTRLDTVERRQITDQSRNEARFERIFDAMNARTFPAQKVFYDGEVFDADVFATRHILSATQSILLIDSWVDVTTLEMLAKKAQGVSVEIVTSPRGNKLSTADILKFNVQYGGLTVKTSTRFHDRFLVIDDRELYLFGASLKDLGRKCFAFTKLDSGEIPGLKARL